MAGRVLARARARVRFARTAVETSGFAATTQPHMSEASIGDRRAGAVSS